MRIPKEGKIKVKALEKVVNEYSLGSFYSKLFIDNFNKQIERTYGKKE